MLACRVVPRGRRALAPVVLGVLSLGALVLGSLVPGVGVPVVGEAGAAGAGYDLSSWTDPDGNAHRIRWNPCQAAVTYAVNPRLAGRTGATRQAAVADVKTAFHRVAARTGITFEFAGRTDEIPTGTAKPTWADRQRAAEIVVAWVDQSRARFRSDLLTDSGSGYSSGVGGWMMRAWTDAGGAWHAAIGRGFVVVNSAHNGRYDPGYGSGMTRGALLLHEVGHVMGLGHVGLTREIMYPTMLNRATTDYHDGDRTGLRKVGSALGCIRGASAAWPNL